MNPATESQILIGTLFFDEMLPLLERIKKDTNVTEFDLISRINHLGEKKLEDLNRWIDSINISNINTKTYKRIRNNLVGIRFSTEKHVVYFESADSPLATDYTGSKEPLTTEKEITFETLEITKDISLLKCALTNELIFLNNFLKRSNKTILKLNSQIRLVNNLIDIFNKLITDGNNKLDGLLKDGRYIMDQFLAIVSKAQKRVSGDYSFCQSFCEANEITLFEIHSTRTRTCKLEKAKLFETNRFINFKNNHKLLLLEAIFHEELLRYEMQILADFKYIEKVFPRITLSLSELKASGEDIENSKLFKKADIALIQAFFNGFVQNSLPSLLD